MFSSLFGLLYCDGWMRAPGSKTPRKLPRVVIGILHHFMSVMFPATRADVSRKLHQYQLQYKYQIHARVPKYILLVGELVDSMIIPLLKLPALTELCFLSIRHYLLSSKCSAHQGSNMNPPDGSICDRLTRAGLYVGENISLVNKINRLPIPGTMKQRLKGHEGLERTIKLIWTLKDALIHLFGDV